MGRARIHSLALGHNANCSVMSDGADVTAYQILQSFSYCEAHGQHNKQQGRQLLTRPRSNCDHLLKGPGTCNDVCRNDAASQKRTCSSLRFSSAGSVPYTLSLLLIDVSSVKM